MYISAERGVMENFPILFCNQHKKHNSLKVRNGFCCRPSNPLPTGLNNVVVLIQIANIDLNRAENLCVAFSNCFFTIHTKKITKKSEFLD